MTEQSKGAGLRFGAIMTLLPVLTAGLGALQYYRDQQQREFEAITFYLQNQGTFDPCADAQLSNLNLGMIENTYPRVYARIVEHVENRASQCDSVNVIAQEQQTQTGVTAPTPDTVARAPAAEEPAAEAPRSAATRSVEAPIAAPNAPVAQEASRQVQMQIPATADAARDYFRNRYDRIASLPTARARRVEEGRYRVLIQISDEADRALAQAIEASLREKGSNTTPTIDLVPIRVAKPELRYYHESQAADAQRMADEIERVLAANGAPAEITPSHVNRPGLPPGVMELWLP